MALLWDVKAVVVPILVDAVGKVSKQLEKHLKRIDIPLVAPCLQKAVLLGIAFILRRLLSISGFGLNSDTKYEFSILRRCFHTLASVSQVWISLRTKELRTLCRLHNERNIFHAWSTPPEGKCHSIVQEKKSSRKRIYQNFKQCKWRRKINRKLHCKT